MAAISAPRAARRRGVTFVEVMVALTVSLIVMMGATTAYIQISGQVADARAYSDATINASVALRDMSFELKQANLNPPAPVLFLGTDVQGAAGDRIDNDGDVAVDEDRPNGYEDAGEDGVYIDGHAVIGTKTERAAFVGVADLGDLGVDSDPVFDRDTIEFRIFPGPTTRNDRVRYYIGEFSGEQDVLLRELQTDVGGPATSTVIEPIAYEVLGLNALYWDANLATPYWVAQWDASAGPFPGPDFELPAAVYLEVTVYAGAAPRDTLPAGAPLKTLTLSTMTNLEAVLSDPRYDTIRPPS